MKRDPLTVRFVRRVDPVLWFLLGMAVASVLQLVFGDGWAP